MKTLIAGRIRWMVRCDMPHMVDIEAYRGLHGWGEEDFLKCLRQRNCIGMVMDVGESVAGYMVYELNKGWLKLLNLGVHPRWRRMGVGGQMVGKLDVHRRTRLVADVHEAELTAQQFFRACGFLARRVIRDYFDTGEDAYRMEYILPAPRETVRPRRRQ